MATTIAKKVGKSIFDDKLNNYKLKTDPRYREIILLDKRGNPTNKRGYQKKPMPLEVPKKDLKILKSVRRRAHLIDRAINICGFRLGLGALIGLIPLLGDFGDFAMALWVYYLCDRIEGGLDKTYKKKMAFNMTVDLAGGFIPVLGDLFDAIYKCNSKNAEELEKQLYDRYCPEWLSRKKGSTSRLASRQNNGVVVDSQATSTTNINHPVQYEEYELGPPPRYATRQDIVDDAPLSEPGRPAPAKLGKQNNASGGWFSKIMGKRDQKIQEKRPEPDLEMAERAPDQPARPPRPGAENGGFI
ncbi:hypothetical protein MMC13_007507 [Lambiella insularis]|nr:hypothetical protein [Lambiella insularis]